MLRCDLTIEKDFENDTLKYVGTKPYYFLRYASSVVLGGAPHCYHLSFDFRIILLLQKIH